MAKTIVRGELVRFQGELWTAGKPFNTDEGMRSTLHRETANGTEWRTVSVEELEVVG